MNEKTFTRVSAVIFSLVALLHLARLVLGWDAVIGGWGVPMWFSWAALGLAGWLAAAAIRLSRR
ncbi:MAG: hypothetical protein HYZ96_02575 [Candidatus Omnitrophica bacterium]|nr:hypothetical protein [Candidatus Omnitrophota bacterium]